MVLTNTKHKTMRKTLKNMMRDDKVPLYSYIAEEPAIKVFLVSLHFCFLCTCSLFWNYKGHIKEQQKQREKGTLVTRRLTLIESEECIKVLKNIRLS